MAAKNSKNLWESARDGNLTKVKRLLGLGNANITGKIRMRMVNRLL